MSSAESKSWWDRRVANKKTTWLVTVRPSTNAMICRVAATGSGRHETWMIEGSRLIDKCGIEHDMRQLRGATVSERDSVFGWSSSHKLRFPDSTVTIRVVDDPVGPNRVAYDMLLDRIHEVMVHHNPDAKFKKRFLHSLGTKWTTAMATVLKAVAVR